jgi:hypothetical protein
MYRSFSNFNTSNARQQFNTDSHPFSGHSMGSTLKYMQSTLVIMYINSHKYPQVGEGSKPTLEVAVRKSPIRQFTFDHIAVNDQHRVKSTSKHAAQQPRQNATTFKGTATSRHQPTESNTRILKVCN